MKSISPSNLLSCFPQGFTVAVPRCLPWPCTSCWCSTQSVWWTSAQSSPIPHSQVPRKHKFPSQCYSSYPSCPLHSVCSKDAVVYLSWKLIFSPLCLLPPHFFLFSFLRLLRMERVRQKAYTAHLFLPAARESKRDERVSLLLLLSYAKEESVGATAYTLQ